MGKMTTGMRMLAMTKAAQGDRMMEPEMRRRRDSRGRYMEQDGGSRMAYEGNPGRMEYGGEARMWPEPHTPPVP